MANLSVTSEELLYNIESDLEELQFMHETFAEILLGVLEQAQEVYARDAVAKGMSEAANPGWYYYAKYNEDSGDRAELDEVAEDEEFWYEYLVA